MKVRDLPGYVVDEYDEVDTSDETRDIDLDDLLADFLHP